MKKFLWSIPVIVIILAVGLYFLMTSDLFQKSEEETLNQFTEAYQNGDYADIYPLINASSKENYSEAEVVERNQQLFDSLGVETARLKDLEKIESESEDDTGQTYVGNLVLDTRYGEMNREYQMDFTYNEEENEWFVEWTPDMIIPGLDDNELSIATTSGARGDILDRNGEPLAFNGTKETVGYIAGQVDESELLETAEVLDMEEESLQSIFNESWIEDGMFVPVKDAHRFDDEEKADFEAQGLSIQSFSEREYPLDEASFHLLGYVGPITAEELEEREGYSSGDMIGKRGIERLYEDRLKPEQGYTVQFVDDSGTTEEELFSEAPKDGEDIILTIDGDTQSTIYENLEEDSGAGVAMDPNNGEMLATVSYPSPSPYDFMFGLSQEEYDALESDDGSPLLNKFNRTTSPGSTQKILTSIIAMNSDTFDRDAEMEITGKGWQQDESWGGYEVNRYHVMDESFDLRKALTYSDNIYFTRTALDLGAETFIEGMEDLGIGQEYDTDYPIYTSQVSNDGTIESDILLADTGYGQGELLISPIQITSIYGAVINGGDVYEPHITLESEDNVLIEDIASQDKLDYLETAMRDVVRLNHPDDTERDYAEFAGKTGTSENKTSQDTRGEETGWFIGYDQSTKDMVMSLYVEDVEDRGMSEYTARKFAEIHDALRE
ncbi:penicillin-binding transpeptidase domain-containing protein [Salinicoccus hispanicus]|uniref:Penicillin-binding transpeptidase domain-containing protein n=1 Tax=Salinicoccus hispanicus TaxID=157225 RepID=A0A6N8U6G3_9STAP|nr:penicillin-binding transpeptidase domain-containing protein [Salinicoccus hispanicus]MXQ52125.1 penicillin-binding transpeptidase domain-containing protein [Salinicoccus hispanicus]